MHKGRFLGLNDAVDEHNATISRAMKREKRLEAHQKRLGKDKLRRGAPKETKVDKQKNAKPPPPQFLKRCVVSIVKQFLPSFFIK